MKVSLVCTVLNEERSIRGLLDSVIAQSKKPDEVIFVDGGSKDGTREIIKEYAKKSPFIKLIDIPGANIARGRNIGIRAAKNEIIATTDGGCVLDKNWLKNLIKNFPEVDISSGVFKPLYQNTFQQCLGELVCPNIKSLPENWPPSAKSNAFKKVAWEKVGGYPEDLHLAEDTIFNYKMKKAGFKYKIARDAIVYWNIRSGPKEVFEQFFNYGYWDGKAKTPLKLFERNTNALNSFIVLAGGYSFTAAFLVGMVFKLNLFLAVLFLALLGYLFIPLPKILLKTKNLASIAYVPLVNVLRRVGYFLGFNFWLINSSKTQKAWG